MFIIYYYYYYFVVQLIGCNPERISANIGDSVILKCALEYQDRSSSSSSSSPWTSASRSTNCLASKVSSEASRSLRRLPVTTFAIVIFESSSNIRQNRFKSGHRLHQQAVPFLSFFLLLLTHFIYLLKNLR